MSSLSFKYFPLVLFFFLLVSGCHTDAPAVLIHKQNRQNISVPVEVAKTSDERRLGLMYRKSLNKDSGMLFIFEEEKLHPFTMKNTYIPLDMIFVSRTRKIVGIAENTRPLTRGPYTVETPSLYVLEVNAGFCRKNGISTGDTVVFKRIPG